MSFTKPELFCCDHLNDVASFATSFVLHIAIIHFNFYFEIFFLYFNILTSDILGLVQDMC